MKKLTAILSLSVFILISISSLVFAAETNMTQTTPAQKIQESQRAKRYATEKGPVHQWIAFLAFRKLCYPDGSFNNNDLCNELSKYIPDENKYVPKADGTGNYDYTFYGSGFTTCNRISGYCMPNWTGAELILGTWDEDGQDTDPEAKYLNHFWDPDNGYDDGLWDCKSAIQVANEDRFKNAIKAYQEGNEPSAYYWLGRTAHLLMDMSVPAHVLLDAHLAFDGYEHYTKEHYMDIKTDSKIPDVSKEIMNYSKSPKGRGTDYPELSNYFYSLAERADNFDSDEGIGEGGEDCPYSVYFSCMQNILQTRAVAYTVKLYELFWKLTRPLNAQLTSDRNTGTAPLTVNFTDLSTGNIKSWYWNFGDGTTSSEQNPKHTYQNPGTYTVSLGVSAPNETLITVKSGYVYVSSGATNQPGYASVSQLTISPSSVTINSNFNISFTLQEVRGASKTFEQLAIAIVDANGNNV